ncbi:zinc metallopeptidase [Aliikangiella sp. IMCC44653]
MHFVIISIIIVLLVFGPQWWVRFVLKKHHKVLDNMPGTGGEVAAHLLHVYQLDQVKLETTQSGTDHYDPESNSVRLSPEYFNGKTLTSIAVAAHEVSHAIQFNRNEPVTVLRRRYLSKAVLIQKVGAGMLMGLPLLGLIVKIPHAIFVYALIGLLVMLSSVFIHAAILPEEWDASFNKALPILEKGNYVPSEYLPAIRQVLKACALTYVAAALANVLSLWRWFALFRMLR